MTQNADRNRYLSPESCALAYDGIPVRYRSDFAPFQRQPQDDALDLTVESVTMMCSSQIIKTTALENIIQYFIAVEPAPILMVQPTIEFGRAFSKERLVPQIRDCFQLRHKVKEAKSRDSDNTVAMKSFPGGNIAIVGANAPAGLASRPRRVVLMDEVDRFPASAGTEGDPCSLAIRRTETFWNAVIYMVSSPTVKGLSRIEKAYEQTDKRMWFCPCPKCGQHQVLKWAQVKWTAEDGSDAVYVCEFCKAELSDDERRGMVMAGEWRPTAPFKGKRGYWLNGINSPFRTKKGFKNRLHQMVAGFLEAKAGGEQTLRAWVNTFLAECWEVEGERLEAQSIRDRAESAKAVPNQVVLVLALGDVQKNRIECDIIGVGEGEESWGIKYSVLWGDTEQDKVWDELAALLRTKYVREDGVELPISATALDMRHKGRRVRDFIRKAGIPRVYAVYGASSETPLLVTVRDKARFGMNTYAVNTKMGKDIVFARLKMDRTGPGFMHFPIGFGYDKEFFAQLTAEVLRKKNGKEVYEKIRDRNEALDIRVYFVALLDILKPNFAILGKKLLATTQKTVEYALKEPPKLEPVSVLPTKSPINYPRRAGGFVNSWRR